MRLWIGRPLTCGVLMALALWPPAWAQEAASPPFVPSTSGAGGSPYLALTAHERWHGFWHETILGTRPVLQIFGTAFIDHIGRQPVGWGLGAQGYAHRVENRTYSTLIDGGVHSSLAALLRQDTRYLPDKDHGPFHRVRHAVARTFVTANQSGHGTFDFSGLAGIYAGAMLPMYWHPRRYSPTAEGVRAGNFGVMFQTGSNLFKEFEPDLKRVFRRHPAD